MPDRPATFPAVLVQRWTGLEGWPVWRVFLATGPDALDPLDAEFPDLASARAAARKFAEASGGLPVVEDGV